MKLETHFSVIFHWNAIPMKLSGNANKIFVTIIVTDKQKWWAVWAFTCSTNDKCQLRTHYLANWTSYNPVLHWYDEPWSYAVVNWYCRLVRYHSHHFIWTCTSFSSKEGCVCPVFVKIGSDKGRRVGSGVDTIFDMDAIIKNIKSIWQYKNKVRIDNVAFTLHKITAGILLFFSLLISTAFLVKDPIECINDKTVEHVINAYCWIHATYTLPEKLNRNRTNRKTVHSKF